VKTSREPDTELSASLFNESIGNAQDDDSAEFLNEPPTGQSEPIPTTQKRNPGAAEWRKDQSLWRWSVAAVLRSDNSESWIASIPKSKQPLFFLSLEKEQATSNQFV